ncbi:aminofutalosine synthase MqnE, partial [Desulfohalovibrio reitneri]|uniref:aminofutalosine synthase MqnE n=1 Tax=Desulfohalovibrio reitneri TaxID=1307759 RepID=UPI0004A6EB12
MNDWLSRRCRALDLGQAVDKVEAGERLSLEDGERLFACPDVTAVGALAHQARTRLHGDRVHYVLNRHINYTNVCVNGCLFCAYSRKAGQKGAFELSIEDMRAKALLPGGRVPAEIHVVGGCHPDLPLSFFEDALRSLSEVAPGSELKCFTAVEIAHFAKLEGIDTREVLSRLKDAGLAMLPGGGAEIFDPEIRAGICPEKLGADDWLRIHGEAHELGLKTNCTMLYGHKETTAHRLDHLDRLRRQQDATGGFLCFIPLSFQARNNPLGVKHGPTGVEDLRTLAVSRLLLDNIPHVKAYWVMLGVKLAQTALYFGADDLDGTVVEEKIGHMAGAESEDALSVDELEAMIRGAGFTPARRGALFTSREDENAE